MGLEEGSGVKLQEDSDVKGLQEDSDVSGTIRGWWSVAAERGMLIGKEGELFYH